MTLSDLIADQARALVAERLGLDFPSRRRADLERGLLDAAGDAGAARYLTRLRREPTDSPDWRRLAHRLTVRESYFFRDGAVLETLAREVLAPLIAERRARGFPRLRLWSAGCASGEEPYSLAMLLDRLLPDRADWALTILGTDLDATALAAARHGTYGEWSLRALPAWARERHFRSHGSRFELAPEIRAMVTFAPLNLAEDAYPGLASGTVALDLVVCRNVLMYFTAPAREATLERLGRALVDGGWLVLGALDASPGQLPGLRPAAFPDCTLYRRDPSLPAPAPATAPELAPPPPPAAARAPSAEALLAQARAEADRGQLERAGELCRQALARDPLLPGAHLLQAAVDAERGAVDAALESLRAAIFLAPGSAAAHFLLGSLLLRRGETETGRRSMETVAGLLDEAADDAPVPGGDGLTAGGLRAAARAHLELAR